MTVDERRTAPRAVPARPRLRRLLVLVALGVLAVAVVVAALVSGPPGPGSVPPPQESDPPADRPAEQAPEFPAPQEAEEPEARAGDVPWPSGVRANSAEEAQVFAAWRGRPVDVVVGFTGRRSWDDVVAPRWLLERHADEDYVHVYSVPPFPESGDHSIADCAEGRYDHHWRRFGRNLARAGEHDAIVRLGWEFNGDWYPWRAEDPQRWAECWRHVHTAVSAAAPQVRWDWNVNRGPQSLGVDPRDAYPGDEYVDIVGVDSYDQFPPATNEARWEAQRDGRFGLEFWAGFAREHGKQMSVPEWGVIHREGGGGDNPDYVRHMYDWFAANADLLAYESYFESDGTPSSFRHRLLADGEVNPLNEASAREYRRLFGGAAGG